jgi:hypothetical protein
MLTLQAPQSPTDRDQAADLPLRRQLAELKGVPIEKIGRIRMTPDKLPALVDVGMILTDKHARHVARDIQTILTNIPDLAQKMGQYKFSGRGGNRNSLVPKDLATLIEIIFLLPDRPFCTRDSLCRFVVLRPNPPQRKNSERMRIALPILGNVACWNAALGSRKGRVRNIAHKTSQIEGCWFFRRHKLCLQIEIRPPTCLCAGSWQS